MRFWKETKRRNQDSAMKLNRRTDGQTNVDRKIEVPDVRETWLYMSEGN